MIKGVIPGPGIQVSNPSSPYFNMTLPDAGRVRYNGGNNYMEVYDGYTWQVLSNHVNISVDPEIMNVIYWAKEKKKEEEELKELAKTNIVIADLLTSLNETKEKIEMVKVLIKDNT